MFSFWFWFETISNEWCDSRHPEKSLHWVRKMVSQTHECNAEDVGHELKLNREVLEYLCITVFSQYIIIRCSIDSYD